MLKRITMWCNLFLEHFPSCSFLFLIPFPLSRRSQFSPVPVRVAFVIWWEPTCPPTHQTHPRWASVLNSEVKTHYRAISPLVMLSNNLISLSVGPVTQQRPCQHGLPCPRVPAALGASPPLPLHAPQLGPSSSKTG